MLIAPGICGRNTQYTNSAAKLLHFYHIYVDFLTNYDEFSPFLLYQVSKIGFITCICANFVVPLHPNWTE